MSMHYLIGNLKQFFSLEKELEDQDAVYEEIKKGVVFRGTNLWILIFAIVIASVGLNMNSTAVIIGAMLISPLMGPINGMGYSMATFNFPLFRKSIKNFSFAIIASLLASTLYFTISPVSTAHSELLARTSPTIYDVLIALFGGLAGIVAISSKQKGNVLPGVAIATALMPPLCTAGYGIATQQWNFFLGAFYLFTINTIFIAIASVWISQLLNFPIRTIVDESKKKKINRIISIVIFIVLMPSIYFGYQLVQQENFNQHALRYINHISRFEGHYLLKHDISAKNKGISLIYSGPTFSERQKKEIIKKAEIFNIGDAIILVNQGISVNKPNEKNSEVAALQEHINSLTNSLNNKDSLMRAYNRNTLVGKSLFQEIKILYPSIQRCLYTMNHYNSENKDILQNHAILILYANPKIQTSERRKIQSWVNVRLNQDSVKIIYE